MNYIVFDLEWNQPPTEEAMVLEPVYLEGEIIEIGAVKLDDHFQTVDEKRLYIRPQYYTKMHRRIATLTGIHDRDLQEKGRPFPEVYEEFAAWCGEEFTYVTWSNSDLPMLLDNMLLHGISTHRLPLCLDAQRVFSREIMRIDRKLSLDEAIRILGEQGDVAHDALHDARNTVKVMNHLDLEDYGEEYYAQVFAEEPTEKVYDSPADVTADEELSRFVCPWCGAPGNCESWLPQKFGWNMTMGTCEEGDEFAVYLRSLRNPTGGRKVMRLFYEMSADLWDIYQDVKGAAV